MAIGDAEPRAGATFRPDIDGLRALAIVLVVAFHTGLPGFGGGFIGVDVFFVISGFLISRQLLDEIERAGTVRLLDFWARRIRRLVPALAAMVVVTVAIAHLMLPALDVGRVVPDGQRSLLYVSNISFARQANDYFASGLDPSVFLHTWSLGIEEQFYLLWPVLVLAGLLLARWAAPQHPRRVLGAIFASLTVASCAWSVVLTRRDRAAAFYLLPSRAWEFGLAGLLACLDLGRLKRSVARQSLAVGGLAAIIVSGIVLGRVVAYPGPWPLVPVLGAAALIAAGATTHDQRSRSIVLLVLGHRAPRWIGRLSYSWYLWHWPFIVLGVRALKQDGTAIRVALAAASLVVAWVAHVAIENPVRFRVRFQRSKPITYGLAALLTTASLLVVGGVGAAVDQEVRHGPLAGLADVRDHRRDFTCARQRTSPSGIAYCEDGDLRSDRTVLLVGDSHVRHWKPAFAVAAEQEGIRLLIRWRPACPSIRVSTVRLKVGGRDVTCDRFRTETQRLISELSPGAVVRSDSHQYTKLIISPDDRDGPELWFDQLREATKSLQRDGIRTGIVADSPSLPFDPVDCLAENGDGPSCTVSKAAAYATKGPLLKAERNVEAQNSSLRVFDITSTLCPDACPLVIDRTYVYSDADHLTEPFVLSQVPGVRAYLRSLMT